MILVDFWVAQTYLTFEVIQATRDDRAIEVMLGMGNVRQYWGRTLPNMRRSIIQVGRCGTSSEITQR